MAQIVEVPGFGDVEFPDHMSDEEIALAIKRNMTPDKPEPSIFSKEAWSQENRQKAAKQVDDTERAASSGFSSGLMIPESAQARLSTALPAITSDKSWAELSADKLKEIEANNAAHDTANTMGQVGGGLASTVATLGGSVARTAGQGLKTSTGKAASNWTSPASPQDIGRYEKMVTPPKPSMTYPERSTSMLDSVENLAKKGADTIGKVLKPVKDFADKYPTLTSVAKVAKNPWVSVPVVGSLMGVGKSSATEAAESEGPSVTQYAIPSKQEVISQAPPEMQDKPWYAITNFLNQTSSAFRHKAKEDDNE